MEWLRTAVRLVWFYLGLAVLSIGYSLVICADLGAGPWDLFHLGLHRQSGIPIGAVIQGTGLVIILLNLTLSIRPSVGMVLNMLSIGPMVELSLELLPRPEHLAGRGLMMVAGLLLAGVGTAFYVSAGLGSGPRDGLMIGLTRKTGWPVAVIKNAIDLIVAAAGWLLGGPLGPGTLFVALALGPSIQWGMRLVEGLSRLCPFSTFVRPVALHRS